MALRTHLNLLKNALLLGRVNNLFIIFLTQYLAAWCLIQRDSEYQLILDYKFFLMVLSTLIIAASGYYINDYHDIKMDLINKPDKVIVGKHIKRRHVMFAHMIFNGFGVLIGAWVSLWIGLVNAIAALILWWYSSVLKKMPFIGNLTVAFLTSATLLMINLYYREQNMNIYIFSFFAFGINLIREIIKDIEDMKGDASFGSNSLPLVVGLRSTKNILYMIIFIYCAVLIYFLIVLADSILIIYFSALFILFTHFVYRLWVADTKSQFSFLSKYAKWIILAGILSMVLLR